MRRRRRIVQRQSAAERELAEVQRIQIDTSDPETRAVWQTAQRAAEEVASWPAWKRGEEPSSDERKRELEQAAWLREWGVGL